MNSASHNSWKWFPFTLKRLDKRGASPASLFAAAGRSAGRSSSGSKAIFAAMSRFFIPPYFLLCLRDHRRKGNPIPGFVDSYERQVRRRGVLDLASEQILDQHLDSDLQRRVEHAVHRGQQPDHLADMNGMEKPASSRSMRSPPGGARAGSRKSRRQDPPGASPCLLAGCRADSRHWEAQTPSTRPSILGPVCLRAGKHSQYRKNSPGCSYRTPPSAVRAFERLGLNSQQSGVRRKVTGHSADWQFEKAVLDRSAVALGDVLNPHPPLFRTGSDGEPYRVGLCIVGKPPAPSTSVTEQAILAPGGIVGLANVVFGEATPAPCLDQREPIHTCEFFLRFDRFKKRTRHPLVS